MTEQGRLDGQERARVVMEYVLANPGVVDVKAFYDANVAAWFEAKEASMRAAGAGNSEIVEYIETAFTSMDAMLNDASNFISRGVGNRHERRRAARSHR